MGESFLLKSYTLFGRINWEYDLWEFERQPVAGDEILCPKCNAWSRVELWKEGEVGCEDCGSHSAIICPICDEYHDHVYAEPFRVREAKSPAE